MLSELGFERFGRRLRRFAEDRSGNILMLFSLSIPVVIGLAALGSEGGALYLKKAAMQRRRIRPRSARRIRSTVAPIRPAAPIRSKARGSPRRWAMSTARTA